MNTAIDSWLDARKDEMVEALCTCVSFPSVQGAAEDGAPFGRPCADALKFMLGRADALGFDTCNMDGYVGYAEMGSGDELLGILAHLDVVPAGEGWNTDPFAPVIIDGKIYGRGTEDDKGCAVAAMYAMKAIKEAGIPMKRRVRLLLGCNEESGWGCMAHYAKYGEPLDMAFSPDAEYPVVNSEKAQWKGIFRRNYSSEIRVHSGTASNIVPNEAKSFVPFDPAFVEEKISGLMVELGFPYELNACPGGTEITVHGEASHASRPEGGRNAIFATLALLCELPLNEEDSKVVKGLHEAFRFDCHCESFGLDCEDYSGRLTQNVGILRWDENGISQIIMDLRCPHTLPAADIEKAVLGTLFPLGFECTLNKYTEGHYVPEDSEIVSCLTRVFAERTGQMLPPLQIGGGTYAKTVKNGVAFGPVMPGCEGLAHVANEFMSIDDLLFNAKLIADAILALAAE